MLLPALACHAETGQLVRIGSDDWVPYVDAQRADHGAVARLVSAVFAAAGYRVEYVFYPWGRNELMLQQGALDAIMPYSCGPARQAYALCSQALARGEMVLFHRQAQPFDWTRIADLARYRLGTTLGYSYGPQFDEAQRQGQLQVEQIGKEDNAFRLLALGRIDLHPQDRAVGYATLRRLFPGTADIVHHPHYLNTETLHLLFRKSDPAAEEMRQRFDQALERFARRGDLARLQEALYSGNADNWQPSGD